MRIAVLTTDSREHYRDYKSILPSFGAAPEALFQGFQAISNLEVHIVSCVQKQVQSPERIADNIFYHGLTVPKIGWLRTGYQGCIRAVRRKLKEIQPAIVHGQGTERDCAISAVFSGFPNVITIHGNMAELASMFHARVGSFHWLTARLEDFTLPRTDGVFCNSAYTEKLVKPRSRRTWRVANPLREEFFAPVSAESLLEKSILVNVGVISARKRQLELLQLASKLRKAGHDFEFRFVGHANPQDPYAKTFLEKIKSMEATGHVRYLGMKSTKELIQCFDNSGAVIHFPTEEAFGLVVAEALARNLKFFGTRVGGIVDIADGIPGVELFALEDWAGLEASISRWIRAGISSSEGVSRLMRERYHPEVIARRHIEIYQEVLSRDS